MTKYHTGPVQDLYDLHMYIYLVHMICLDPDPSDVCTRLFSRKSHKVTVLHTDSRERLVGCKKRIWDVDLDSLRKQILGPPLADPGGDYLVVATVACTR